jgi:hypothetical protein
MPPQRIGASSSSTSGPKNIESWDFSPLDLDDGKVVQAALWMLQNKRGSYSRADSETMVFFCRAVCKGYFSNPYHNVRHAVDVMHAVWRCGDMMPWGQIFQKQEQFALLVAGFSHDIGHFGLTNSFLVDLRHELALRYNDLSPLEHMHCSQLFGILAEARTNVLDFLQPKEYKAIRSLMIDAILQTDPLHHFPMIKDLQNLYTSCSQAFASQKVGELSDDVVEVFTTSKDNKNLVARLLLHGADLSNSSKPWKIACDWAKVVVAEFFAQGDLEKALGLPVGPLNDREKVSLPSCQLGFIQHMISPFAASFAKIFVNWRDIPIMLGKNAEEWRNVYLEESGVDETEQVEAIRACLELDAPKDTIMVKDNFGGKALSQNEKCDLDAISLPNWPTSPSNEKRAEADKRHRVVREVRRWQEDQEGNDSEAKKHRELVLLYVVSDGEVIAAHGKDYNMKINGNNSTHFNEPEPVPDEPPIVMTVAVAADNMCAKLNRDSFDHLLAGLLEKRARPPSAVLW